MNSNHNRRLAVSLLAVAVGMLGLAFAAVPLYDIFCRVTGYGGTTQEAKEFPDKVYDRVVTVRFNGDIAPGLPWHFKPQQLSLPVKIGEQKLAFYDTENRSDQFTTGTATYNVTPEKVGIYFNKVKCFCYDRQPLQANQSVVMPVSFFIDPDFMTDPEMADVDTITLSYTFFATP